MSIKGIHSNRGTPFLKDAECNKEEEEQGNVLQKVATNFAQLTEEDDFYFETVRSHVS